MKNQNNPNLFSGIDTELSRFLSDFGPLKESSVVTLGRLNPGTYTKKELWGTIKEMFKNHDCHSSK